MDWVLEDLDTRLALMEATPEALEKSDDPFVQLAVQLYESDLEIENNAKELAGLFDAVRPRLMEAMIAYNESLDKAIYPDANSTLRVTFGSVKGYSPVDAVKYTPFTTLMGIKTNWMAGNCGAVGVVTAHPTFPLDSRGAALPI